MRVLVTGAGGMLGRDAVAEFRRRGAEVLPLTRAKLDITQFALVREAIAVHRPDLVVNCAAYTNVDGAETDRAAAFRVNGVGVRHLALACREADLPLMHFSTDYVFDGTGQAPWSVYSPRCPLNAYGASKYWGERALEESGCRYYLLRISWLCGHGGPNFIETMLRLAAEWKSGGEAAQPLRVVDDQRGSPTFTFDVALAAADLAATGVFGTYHVTNSGTTTWYDFARAVFIHMGWDVSVVPISTDEFPRPARRPGNSVLDPFPLAETIGYLLPPWEDALERYLARRSG